jgi:glycosidase
MEGYRDPFNRRTYPWGREDMEFLEHFKRLGQLRKDYPALRLGEIAFFEAGDKHIGFTRTYEGKTLRIYVNRSADSWEIRSGKIVLGYNLQLVACDSLTLGPRGFMILED